MTRRAPVRDPRARETRRGRAGDSGPAGSGGSGGGLGRAVVGSELGKEEHDHRRRCVWGARDSSRSSNEGTDGKAFFYRVCFILHRPGQGLAGEAVAGRDALPAAPLRPPRARRRESGGRRAAGSVPSCQTTVERMARGGSLGYSRGAPRLG